MFYTNQSHSTTLLFQLYLINPFNQSYNQKGFCMPDVSTYELLKLARLHLETLEQSFNVSTSQLEQLFGVRHEAFERLCETILEIEDRLERPALRRVK
ncbi:hypothetical protein YTPLAS21_19320 [Candidatus Nitrosocosmicus sp.]|nr:hypothetical protein YTPLAS21_19320 [Candidatus Nitrosocosmicus sp.]